MSKSEYVFPELIIWNLRCVLRKINYYKNLKRSNNCKLIAKTIKQIDCSLCRTIVITDNKTNNEAILKFLE